MRGPDRTIPTCVGLMRMNLAVAPCSAQPGTAISLNFGDAALGSPVGAERAAPILRDCSMPRRY